MCGDVNVTGDGTAQRVLVLASGISGLQALQFGIEYDSTVVVESWQSCATGIEAAGTDWPASGDGIGLAWLMPQSPQSEDEFVAVGAFEIAAGSSGMIRLTGDPRRNGTASYATEGAPSLGFVSGALGSVSVDGGRAAYRPCGYLNTRSYGTVAGASLLTEIIRGDNPGVDIDPNGLLLLEGIDYRSPRVYCGKVWGARGQVFAHPRFGFITPNTHRAFNAWPTGGSVFENDFYTGSINNTPQGIGAVEIKNWEDRLAVVQGGDYAFHVASRANSFERADGFVYASDSFMLPEWSSSFSAADLLPGDDAETFASSVSLYGADRIMVAGYYSFAGDRIPFLRSYRRNGVDPDWTLFSGEPELVDSRVVGAITNPANGVDVIMVAEDLANEAVQIWSADPFTGEVKWSRLLVTSIDPLLHGLTVAVDKRDFEHVVIAYSFEEQDDTFEIPPHRLHVLSINAIDGSIAAGGGLASSELIRVHDVETSETGEVWVCGMIEGVPAMVYFDQQFQEASTFVWQFTAAQTDEFIGFFSIDVDGPFAYATGSFGPLGAIHRRTLTACVGNDGIARWHDALDASSETGDDEFNQGRSIDVRRAGSALRILVSVDAGDLVSGNNERVGTLIADYVEGAVVAIEPHDALVSAASWRALGGQSIRVRLNTKARRDQSVLVFDVAGRLIAKTTVFEGRIEADVSDVSSGVYFVQLPSLDGDAQRAIVVR